MPTTIDLLLDRAVPQHTPDQLHGLACALLEGPGVDHEAQVKPFTIWPLRQEQQGQVLRLTLLADGDQRGRQIPQTLRLGSRFVSVRGRVDGHVPFSALACARPRLEAALSFETPTYFSRNGRDVPLPDPVLIYRSLTQRWNLHAPTALTIDAETGDHLLRSVVVEDLDIRTIATGAAHRQRRTGFIGHASFRLTRAGLSASSAFAALTRAAEYLGVGAQTTRGFGVALEADR